MSAKDCGKHGIDCTKLGIDCERRRLYRRCCGALVALILLVLFIILIVWLVLRPTKPRYYLQDTTVLGLNVTETNCVTITMQITVAARNPNERVGIYYDKLDVYALYKNQQITVPTGLPPGYQGHLDMAVWSPFLSGVNVPLAPYLAVALMQDETAGYLLINIRVDGLLRWKVGTWISDHYHLTVNCPALLTVNEGKGCPTTCGDGDGVNYHFRQASTCSVDI